MRNGLMLFVGMVLAFLATTLFFLVRGGVVRAEEYKNEYYEKNGCIYLTGNLTQEEKVVGLRLYKERRVERRRQLEIESKARQEIRIETIKAQAMRDYLIAQGIPLREIADAYRRTRIRQNVVIGDITNTSKGGAGGSATNINTSTNTNSAIGGSGGTSTHNNY